MGVRVALELAATEEESAVHQRVIICSPRTTSISSYGIHVQACSESEFSIYHYLSLQQTLLPVGLYIKACFTFRCFYCGVCVCVFLVVFENKIRSLGGENSSRKASSWTEARHTFSYDLLRQIIPNKTTSTREYDDVDVAEIWTHSQWCARSSTLTRHYRRAPWK